LENAKIVVFVGMLQGCNVEMLFFFLLLVLCT
jgi:hypothetical protein